MNIKRTKIRYHDELCNSCGHIFNHHQDAYTDSAENVYCSVACAYRSVDAVSDVDLCCECGLPDDDFGCTCDYIKEGENGD